MEVFYLVVPPCTRIDVTAVVASACRVHSPGLSETIPQESPEFHGAEASL
jgi:hypothetical protein